MTVLCAECWVPGAVPGAGCCVRCLVLRASCWPYLGPSFSSADSLAELKFGPTYFLHRRTRHQAPSTKHRTWHVAPSTQHGHGSINCSATVKRRMSSGSQDRVPQPSDARKFDVIV